MALSVLRLCSVRGTALSHRPISSTSVNIFNFYRELFSPEMPHTAAVMKTFSVIHEATGMPWWATIVSGGFLLRTVLALPLQVATERNMARVLLLKPKVAYVHRLIDVRLRPKDKKQKSEWNLPATKQGARQQLYEADQCHPAISVILPLWQFPLWITASFAVRNMCGIMGTPPWPGMDSGGFGWMPSLTVPDPLFILPAALFVVNFLSLELVHLARNPDLKTSRKVVWGRRVIFLFFSSYIFFLGLIMPQAMSLYWMTSSLHVLLMRFAFMFPAVKRIFKVPATPMDSRRPMANIADNLRNFVTGKKA